LFRIFEGYVKCDWKVLFINKDLEESILSDESSSVFVHDVTVCSAHSNFNDLSINVQPRKKSLWRKVESDMIKGVNLN